MTGAPLSDPSPFSWAHQPPPTPLARDEIEARIHRAFPEPEAAEQVLSLIRPSIHLWPGPPIDPKPRSLRLGGLPYAPAGWTWPRYHERPLLLIGQFDCALLAPHPASALLPPDGTLAFFAGPDFTYGDIFGGPEHALVFYWPAGIPLHLTETPEPDIGILPLSGVQAFDAYELPGYGEPAIAETIHDQAMRNRYFEFRYQLYIHIPPNGQHLYNRTATKLFGWPNYGAGGPARPTPQRLLLQAGAYDNGEAQHDWVANGCGYFMIEGSALMERRFDRIDLDTRFTISPSERSKFPLPTARTRASISQEIATRYPDDFGKRLEAKIRPALLLWPRPAPEDPRASRLGGKPLAPRGWEWPTYLEEPMLFVAQINCAELTGEAAALLPRDGLLCFFGDPDIATGCDGGGGTEEGAVFYWPPGTDLVTHDPPEEDVQILLSAGVEFLETLTLPDLFSGFAGERADDRDFRMGYPNTHGIALPKDTKKQPDMSDLTQLLGWHHLVQSEMYICEDPAWRLLFQVGTYDDGWKEHWWGPGGTIYFMIREEDLAAHRFDNVVFDAQCT